MISNFLKIALRNLRNNKTFSLINILGLTIGTASCLYIFLYVQDHKSYDTHHTHVDNLYRIISDLYLPNEQEDMHMSTCSPPIPIGMKQDFPEVVEAARLCSPPGVEQNLIRVGDRVLYEKKGYYVDSTFFRVLDYHFVAGDPQHALDEPYSVVVSQSLAHKLFPNDNAIGNSIGIGGGGEEEEFKITGVFDDAFGKSHLMPEFFMTMNSGGIGEYIRGNTSWAGNNFIYGYVRLKPGTDPRTLEEKLPAFLTAHGAEQFEQLGMRKILKLQPVKDIHTTLGLTADFPTNTSERFLHILLLIAGFIQLVACINFMNLTTARSAHRAQEVGVRKVVGAPRWAMATQFLGESLLLTLFAMAFAIPLLQLMMPFINTLTGADVELQVNGRLMTMMAGLIVFTGVVAGSYPAFYLSSFKPLAVLRGFSTSKGSQSAAWLRKGMVVSQFAISIALVLSALIIRFQLDYIRNKDLGFEKHQKIVFPFRTAESQEGVERFRNQLMQLPEVSSASAMAVYPGQSVYNDLPAYKEGQDMNTATDLRFTYVDENYLKTLKIGLIAGREFVPGDTSTVRGEGKAIINEMALKRLGIAPEDAPGQILYSEFEDQRIKIHLVGVMQDFLYQDLSTEMDPFMVLFDQIGDLSHVIADVQTTNYTEFFRKAEDLWSGIVPDVPFEYSFLDDDIAKMYAAEQVLSKIISAFTLIAILISCLGLFGLSAFTAEQRTKEIGIRKVLGATTSGIVGLLSRDFLKLVIIAIFIASPIAYFVMQKWLAEFAYRIDIEWWIFGLAGLVAVAIAFLTVSFQSVKAALSNPVKSLRSE